MADRLVPGHLASVKDKKTKEVIKNVWDLVVETSRDPDGGNRKRKVQRFNGNKRDADSELQRLRMFYSNCDVPEPTNILLRDYLKTWLQSVVSDGTEYTFGSCPGRVMPI